MNMVFSFTGVYWRKDLLYPKRF